MQVPQLIYADDADALHDENVKHEKPDPAIAAGTTLRAEIERLTAVSATGTMQYKKNADDFIATRDRKINPQSYVSSYSCLRS